MDANELAGDDGEHAAPLLPPPAQPEAVVEAVGDEVAGDDG